MTTGMESSFLTRDGSADWDLLAWKEVNWGKHGRNLWSMNGLKSHFWLKGAVGAKGLLTFKGQVYKPGAAKSKKGYVRLRNSLSLKWLDTGRTLAGSIIYMIALLTHTLFPTGLLWPMRQQLFGLSQHSCFHTVWLPWGSNLKACPDDLTVLSSINKMVSYIKSAVENQE